MISWNLLSDFYEHFTLVENSKNYLYCQIEYHYCKMQSFGSFRFVDNFQSKYYMIHLNVDSPFICSSNFLLDKFCAKLAVIFTFFPQLCIENMCKRNVLQNSFLKISSVINIKIVTCGCFAFKASNILEVRDSEASCQQKNIFNDMQSVTI